MLKKSFSLFLSLRYLRPKRTFVSVITIISVGGVALAVFALTVVIAVMTGFNIQMRESILGFQPHAIIKDAKEATISDWREISDDAGAHPEVIDAAPFSYGQGVLDFDNRVLVVELKGVIAPEPNEEAKPIWRQYETLVEQGEGRFDLEGENVVVGRELANGFGIIPGDKLLFHSLVNGRELLDAQSENREPLRENLIEPAELTVTGVYSANRPDFESKVLFVPFEIGQRLYGLEGGASGIALQVNDPHKIRPVKQALTPSVAPLIVETWIDRNKAIFDAVALERMNMYVLLFMIMVVAGFCIMNTMITVTTQKRGEIGLMKAVGGRTSQVVGPFLYQGIIVGLVGTATGLIVAFFFLLLRKHIAVLVARISGIDLFSSQGMRMLYELPAQVTIVDVAVISGGAFLCCALASLMPAYFAARLDAAQALRNEGST